MPDIGTIKGELYRYRRQIQRQRNEIIQLQRAGVSTASQRYSLSGCSPRWIAFEISETNCRRIRRAVLAQRFLAAADGRPALLVQ